MLGHKLIGTVLFLLYRAIVCGVGIVMSSSLLLTTAVFTALFAICLMRLSYHILIVDPPCRGMLMGPTHSRSEMGREDLITAMTALSGAPQIHRPIVGLLPNPVPLNRVSHLADSVRDLA
jgi:hypothetical protein